MLLLANPPKAPSQELKHVLGMLVGAAGTATPNRIHPRTKSGPRFYSEHGGAHPRASLQPIIAPFQLAEVRDSDHATEA